MTQDFNSAAMLQLILKWKKQLLIVLIVAIAAACIGSSSFFIKPKFKSTGTVYPVNLLPYGEESTTEQLLQLLQSVAVRDSVIKKFNLSKHYDISDETPEGKSYLILEYNDNVSISKTDLEAAEIKVMDTDPETACAIVNEIIHQVNMIARNLQRKSSYELLSMYSKQINAKKEEIDSMEVLIKSIRVNYGIIDFDAQAKEATKVFLKVAGSATDTSKMRNLQAIKLMHNMQEKGGDFLTLKNRIFSEKTFYFKIIEEFNIVKRDCSKELTYTNIVSKPYPATRKSYPVRWLIVLIAVVACMVFSLIVIGFIDRKNIATNSN